MDTYLDSKAELLLDSGGGGGWTESFTTTVNYDNLWQIIFAVQSPGCRIIIIYYVVYSSVHSLPPSHIPGMHPRTSIAISSQARRLLLTQLLP